MLRLLSRIIWNALPLVALVLVGSWAYDHWKNSPAQDTNAVFGGTEATIVARSAILERVQQVNKQLFIEHYNAVDVQYSEAPEGWIKALGIKQEFVVLVRGRVPAGFDMSHFSEDDIWISTSGKRAQLTLPPPVVFEDNVAIDFENSYILAQRDTCPGFICKDDLVAYQSEVLPAGRQLLAEYALQNGILEQAARDAKAFYEELLRGFGFAEVRVIVTGYDL